MVNVLKALFGDDATPENDFGYAWLPKRNAAKDYSLFGMFESALAGTMKMLWVVGQNPAVTLPNLRFVREAFAKLELLVVQELWETETAAFWQRPGVDPKTIQTEVLLLPAAFFMEKDGSITNSGAMVQWRHAAVKPPGQAQARRRDRRRGVPPRARPRRTTRPIRRTRPIQKAYWTYTERRGRAEGDQRPRLRDVPGTNLKAGDLGKVADLQSDGSTSCGRLDVRRASSPAART